MSEDDDGGRFRTPEGYLLVFATPSADMVCSRCGSTVSTYAHDLHDDWHERLEGLDRG